MKRKYAKVKNEYFEQLKQKAMESDVGEDLTLPKVSDVEEIISNENTVEEYLDSVTDMFKMYSYAVDLYKFDSNGYKNTMLKISREMQAKLRVVIGKLETAW